MKAQIRRGSKGLYLLLPNQVISEIGWASGQELDIELVGGELRLKSTAPRSPEPDIASALELVHKEALSLFEGDEIAKERWMGAPVLGLGNRAPNQMLNSPGEIEVVRRLIGKLDRGSLV